MYLFASGRLMNRKDGIITWVLNDLAELAEFSGEFRSYCEDLRLDEGKIFDLELSLEELIVNSFTHGYRENEKGTVTVEARDTGTEVRISLRDQAPPFDLFRDAPAPRLGGEHPEAEQPGTAADDVPAEAKNEKGGGLGIHLVKSLNDRLEYYGSQDGNRIIIIKAKS